MPAVMANHPPGDRFPPARASREALTVVLFADRTMISSAGVLKPLPAVHRSGTTAGKSSCSCGSRPAVTAPRVTANDAVGAASSASPAQRRFRRLPQPHETVRRGHGVHRPLEGRRAASGRAARSGPITSATTNPRPFSRVGSAREESPCRQSRRWQRSCQCSPVIWSDAECGSLSRRPASTVASQ